MRVRTTKQIEWLIGMAKFNIFVRASVLVICIFIILDIESVQILKKYKDKMLASNMRSAKSDCSQAYLK